MATKLIAINLLPGELRSGRMNFTWLSDRRVIYPTLSIILVSVVCLFFWMHIKEEIARRNVIIEKLRTEVEQNRPLLEQVKQLEQQLSVIAQKNKALKSIQVSKKRWVILFENISSILPANMWLNAVLQESEAMLEIRGVTYDFSEIADYMVKLEEQVSFTSVSLVSITTMKAEGGDNAFSFTLKCAINTQLGLEAAN